MIMEYICQPPRRWTFEQPKLKKWVEGHCEGKVLNLFAGKVRLDVDEVRVDIWGEFNPDHQMSAKEFLEQNKWTFQTVILDPPYNIRKGREKYGGKYIGRLTEIKNLLVQLKPQVVISLGYDSVGMSRSRGYRKEALCVVCHGGDHNDTLCLVERLK
jgi:hypothetical protein